MGKTHRWFAIATAAVGLAAMVGVIGPVGAARADTALTAVNGVFTGTAGDDELIIGVSGSALTHNHGGDPGFASNEDFDSSVAGVQTRAVGDEVSFIGGAGDDTFKVVGALPNPISNFDGGAGNDTVDVSDATGLGGASEGYSFGQSYGHVFPTVEKLIGTAGPDAVQPDSLNPAGATIIGGDGNDQLNGGVGNDYIEGDGGTNTLSGDGGDDTLVLSVPVPTAETPEDCGDGNDTVVVVGTPGADNVLLAPEPQVGLPNISTDASPNGGYNLYSCEHVAFSLLGGDDAALIEPDSQTVAVDGGAGNDTVLIDAYQRTAQDVTDGANNRDVTIPDFAPVHVANTVESMSIFNETLIATGAGPGGGPHVRTFRADGTPEASFFAYDPNFHGGVNVALGDLDGDGDDEIITGAGPGGGPHVRVFRSDGSPIGSFFAYDPQFTGGVEVAAADLDGDGVDELITVPEQGGGPDVRIWSLDGDLLGEFGAPGFGNTGLRVARGASQSDGSDTLVISAASGPSMVRVVEGDGSPTTFPSYSPYPGFTGGAAVANGAFVSHTSGSLADGMIVTGAGPGGGPHVRIVEDVSGSVHDVDGFYAYDPNFHGGVNVATCNPDGGADEILTGAGPGGGPHVRMFTQSGTPLALSFFAYGSTFAGGVSVACGGAVTKSYS